MASAEFQGRRRVGGRLRVPVAVDRVGLVDPVGVRRLQDAAVAHETGGAARGERPAAETEEPYLVARLVVLHDEGVRGLDVARQPHSEGAAPQAVEPARTDPGDVGRRLHHAGVVTRADRQQQLRHIRERAILLAMVERTPGTVTAHDDALRHDAPDPWMDASRTGTVLTHRRGRGQPSRTCRTYVNRPGPGGPGRCRTQPKSPFQNENEARSFRRAF